MQIMEESKLMQTNLIHPKEDYYPIIKKKLTEYQTNQLKTSMMKMREDKMRKQF